MCLIVLFSVCCSLVASKEVPCEPGALGMEDGTITDDQITASSYQIACDLKLYPWKARPSIRKYWRPHEDTLDMLQVPWIQVDFLETVIITGIQTQGSDSSSHKRWISKLHVQTGNSVDTLTYIMDLKGNPQIFSANTNYNLFVMITFPEPISTRYLRIVPTECEHKCGLNFEVVGCRLINECEMDTDTCDINAECHDQDNGYQCRSICKPTAVNGFQCQGEQWRKNAVTPGNKAGAVIGAIILIIITALITVYLVKRKSQNKHDNTAPPIVGEDGYVEYQRNDETCDQHSELNQPPASDETLDSNLAVININELPCEISSENMHNIISIEDNGDIDGAKDSTSDEHDTNDIEHTYAYSYAYTERSNEKRGNLGGEQNERAYINSLVRR
ncbi:uncharacterized protein [Amphiura filiformis]|uniref:uncharacterized protein n=1 Tax=Amphiura filiformis TaxID=82378 RepID=UPI003B211067